MSSVPTNSEIEDALRKAAVRPARASNETGSVEAHPLPDQVEALRSIRSDGAARRGLKGLRVTQVVPGGTL